MITLNPPAKLPFIPSTQEVSFVALNFSRMTGTDRANLGVGLFDAKKQPIAIDHSQVRAPNAAEMTTALGPIAPAAGPETWDANLERRFAPYLLTVYGVSGTSTP